MKNSSEKVVQKSKTHFLYGEVNSVKNTTINDGVY